MKSESPPLIAFKGLPGCGKTTLSRALGQSLGWPVVSKDDFSAILDERLTDYGPLAHELLWNTARALLSQGFSVICDSTLMGATSYAQACRVARETGADLIVVECYCSDERLWRQRIEARKDYPTRYLSNWEEFQDYVRRVAPRAVYPMEHPILKVDTVQPLSDTLHSLVTWLRMGGRACK
jgi:predicted kinase